MKMIRNLALAMRRPPDVSDVTASIISGLSWPKLPEETVKLHPKVCRPALGSQVEVHNWELPCGWHMA